MSLLGFDALGRLALGQLSTIGLTNTEAMGPDSIRHQIEKVTGEFYQPKTRAGRYAETIGEMAPMVLGGEGLSVVRGAQAAGTALRELPATLAQHAVAPGVAVQTLEEA